jgi:hypothetical protein
MAKLADIVGSGDLSPRSQRTSSLQRGEVPSDTLVPMQFKMTEDFATSFRVEATKRGLKYNQLLKECFTLFLKESKK